MLKKLILIGLVVASSNVFSDQYSDYQQRQYQQEMLRQQQEQTRLMQESLAQQRMYNDAQQQGHHAFRDGL